MVVVDGGSGGHISRAEGFSGVVFLLPTQFDFAELGYLCESFVLSVDLLGQFIESGKPLRDAFREVGEAL